MNCKKWPLAVFLMCASGLHAGSALAQLNGGTASMAGEPYNVTALSYPSATQAAVSWASDGPPVTAFKVERRIVGSRGFLPVTSVADAVRSTIDGNLLPNTAYEYRVSAIRPESATPLVSTGQVILVTPGSAAGVSGYDRAATPRKLAAQPMNSNEVMLEWVDVTPDETGFKVERLGPDGQWRALDMAAPNSTTYRDRGLQAGATYQYRVAAMRDYGSAVPTAPVIASTPAAGVTAIYYVDAVNGSNANPGTEARPWASIQKAHDTMAAGQTVLVRKGTYVRTNNYTVVQINRSGLAGAPITYRNYPGEHPLIKTTKGVNNHGMEVRDAAWIVIDGFEVQGHVKEISYEEAKAQNDLALAYSKMTPPKFITAIVDSNGISLTGKTLNKTHHIVVRNNVVHDVPGAGIAGGLTDYITFEGNRIWNTSSYSPYGTSGISLLVPYDLDTNTSSYRNSIVGNVVSEAINLFPCNCFGFKQPTDGNGIILDTFNKNGYTGRTLVANNIVFNNGGRGIHALNSSYIDVFGNTMVRNGTQAITGEGEISTQKSKYMRIHNNIMLASSDRPLTNFNPVTDTNIDISHNIMFGGTRNQPTPGAVDNRIVNPAFVATSGASMFQPAANSPAIDSAYAPAVLSPYDVNGAPRVRGNAADVGAVEAF
jgi:parallel beta-helix repeat protein